MKWARRFILLILFLCGCTASKPIDYSIAIDSAEMDDYFVLVDSVDSALVRVGHVKARPAEDTNPKLSRVTHIVLFILVSLVAWLI